MRRGIGIGVTLLAVLLIASQAMAPKLSWGVPLSSFWFGCLTVSMVPWAMLAIGIRLWAVKKVSR